ncbi:MAG: T9SS type A sorting domain-containing protein [Bacteroidota bacterium]
MSTIHRFLFFYLLFFNICCQAQVSCANLSLIGIYPDSLQPNAYWVSIQFDGSQNTVINYPYVSTVLNCQGDTLATGSMFYFGQLGQTTQDYPTDLTGAAWCEPLTFEFIYGNEFLFNDTCYFNYGTAEINRLSAHASFSIAPNPAHDFLSIEFQRTYSHLPFEIRSLEGKTVVHGTVNGKQLSLPLNSLGAGTYFFYVPSSSEQAPFIKL